MIETLAAMPVEAWTVLCQMAPYLLFGFAVAGILAVAISPETVERHLGGRGLLPVFKASLFGVPLPLCSCGVIPVGASLRRHGASRGAVTAFLLSTPQTGVDSILVTLGLLGPVFAVFRPIAALVTGMAGGGLVALLDDREQKPDNVPPCTDECCADGGKRNRVLTALRYALLALPRDIGKPLLIGLIAVGLISTLVPDDYFAGALGSGFAGMLVMMLLGLPVYVCATASVPVAAALIAKGVSPGAALAFLMTGPATNAATIATIWKVMGRRTAMIYLGTVAVCALLFGTILDGLYTAIRTAAPVHAHHAAPGYVGTVSALVLLAVLSVASTHPARAHGKSGESGGSPTRRVTLMVTGMHCSHCVASVRRALSECAGVSLVDVDLGAGRAVVQGATFDVNSLLKAIRSLGYEAREPG